MARVVEPAQDPAVAERHDVGDRRVVAAEERERPPGVGDLGHDLGDHAAVGHDDDPLAGVGGDDAPQRAADPLPERVGRLGAGDDVPALLGDHLHGDRMALGDALAVQLALPVTEVDLAQVTLDDRLQAEAGGQRRRGLHGAAQRRDVDGVDLVARQAVGQALGLGLDPPGPGPGRRGRRRAGTGARARAARTPRGGR